MFRESRGFVATPVTSCIKDAEVPIYPYIIIEERRNRPSDRNSNETATLRKHVTIYKLMRKWMVEFGRKFKNRVIKIARVTSFRINKTIKSLLL